MSEMQRLIFWTAVLNLPGFRVVHHHQDTPKAPLCFTLSPIAKIAVCPHCSHACDTVHRRHPSKPIKDLPLGEHAVELVVNAPQFACDHCRRFFTPTYAAIGLGAHATERFLAHAARLIDFSDVANVAALYGVPASTLARWYYDYIERQRQIPQGNLKPIQSVGIDELSQKKSTASSSA